MVGTSVHVAGPPPMSVVHALPMNYNVPPPVAVEQAPAGTQLSYVTVAHTLSSVPAPTNVVCTTYNLGYNHHLCQLNSALHSAGSCIVKMSSLLVAL